MLFNTGVRLMHRVGTDMRTVQLSIEAITCDGGTRIAGAIPEGIGALRDNPSPVGWNHLVVVTDGEDYYAADLMEEHVALAKKCNTSVDVLLIVPDKRRLYMAAEENLRELAKRTQGRLVTVQDADSMQKAFREVAHRPLLYLESGQ